MPDDEIDLDVPITPIENFAFARAEMEAAGFVLDAESTRAMEELNAGRARRKVGRGSVSGRLRVSMPVLCGRLCIAPVLTKLAAANPDLELELQFTDRVADLIEDGIDLSIRMGQRIKAST